MSKLTQPKFFPPPELAEPEGVVLFGGQLTPDWLLDAYAHGIFPWPIFHETDIMVWWSPDPRAIFEPSGSTNALIHLTAIAGRAGVRVDLDGFDRLGRATPVLVD